MASDPSTGVREITDEEAAHFHRNGWVKLPGLFKPSVVDGLLERAQARMGQEPLTVDRASPENRVANEFRWYARWDGCAHHDDWIRSLSQSSALARVAMRLMADPARSPVPAVRYYFDHFFVKLPVTRDGSETPWHQDLAHHPLDRQGALTIWTALGECPPEKGSLRFLNGSHRAGLFGRYLNRDDGVTLVDDHPWVLDEFELSPPLHLEPGDATVHDLAIIHYAPENRTDTPRWVHSTQWIPANARYTGAPQHRTDGLGLPIDRPLEHPRFPVVPT